MGIILVLLVLPLVLDSDQMAGGSVMGRYWYKYGL